MSKVSEIGDNSIFAHMRSYAKSCGEMLLCRPTCVKLVFLVLTMRMTAKKHVHWSNPN